MTSTTEQLPAASLEDITHGWDGLVPLADVLAHVAPAYGGDSWDEVRTFLTTTCACESQIVQTLIGDLTAAGEFREPVRISVPDGTDPEDSLSIGNGMHRLIATWVAGNTHIKVSPANTKDEDLARVAYTLTPIEGRTQATGCGCDGDDDFWPSPQEAFAFSWMRSVRLNADTWSEADYTFQRSGTFYGHYYVPEAQVPALLEALTATAETGGWTFTSTEVTYGDYDTHLAREEAEDEAELAARQPSAEGNA